MKTLLLTALCFSISSCFCQTELILLGSAHTESDNLTLQKYESLIDSINPDVILFELDSTDMTQSFGFKQVMLDYLATSRNEKGQQKFFEIYAVDKL